MPLVGLEGYSKYYMPTNGTRWDRPRAVPAERPIPDYKHGENKCKGYSPTGKHRGPERKKKEPPKPFSKKDPDYRGSRGFNRTLGEGKLNDSAYRIYGGKYSPNEMRNAQLSDTHSAIQNAIKSGKSQAYDHANWLGMSRLKKVQRDYVNRKGQFANKRFPYDERSLRKVLNDIRSMPDSFHGDTK